MRIRGWLGRAFLAIWAPLSVTVIGLLMVNHTVAMPSPSDLQRLRSGVDALRGDAERITIHVIYAGCSCTDRLIDHLIARGAGPGPELVFFVGQPLQRHLGLSEAGYQLVLTDDGALRDQLSIDAAPVLIEVAQGQLSYVGGYFRYPAAVRPLDVSLRHAVDAGQRPEPLPVFGCAVTPELAARLDPLGLQR